MSTPLLEVRGLSRVYPSLGGGRNGRDITALRDFDLTIDSGRPQITAIVGESGSGKTTLANLILGFDRPTRGDIRFEGRPLDLSSRAAMKAYRKSVQAVFQDPFASFNPFYRIAQVFDVAARNFGTGRAHSPEVAQALNDVGLNGSEVLDKYPHQLSGGQRQRIMIARAIVMGPKLIVADEPVSMVDASLRSSILSVMAGLKAKGISFIYITHDLSTVWQFADRVEVLYRGHLMERGPARRVIEEPCHPYVQLLVDSVPPLTRSDTWRAPARVQVVTIPVAGAGCAFADSCPHAWDLCRRADPPLTPLPGAERASACHLHSRKTAE